MDTKSLFGLIILTALIIWGVVTWGSRPQTDKSSANKNSNAIEQTTKSDELILGPPDAPVKMVEYADPQCPFCAIANQIINKMMDDNPNKIQLTYRHFPLSYHPLSRQGALAMQAAHRQGKFKEMKDLIFQRQKDLTADSFKQFATEIGLNMDKYQQDISDSKLKDKVEQDYQNGLKRGVNGTPTIYLNGKILENFSDTKAFQDKINQIVNQ